MKVLEKRFLRGPNIYRMSPCFVSVLDLEGHRPVGLARHCVDNAMATFAALLALAVSKNRIVVGLAGR